MVTDDFETGFTDGFHWRGPDGLAEFLDARSVFFDQSHEVLQVMNVSRPGEREIHAQTRACGSSYSPTNPGPPRAKSPLGRRGTPGGCGANRLRAVGEWRLKLSTDLLS